MLDEDGFDSICVDPKPGSKALMAAKSKVKFVDSRTIDTSANMKWRKATIAFAKGEISPKKWFSLTSACRETVHFLTSPATKPLREEMSSVPVDPGGTYSARSVFAEMLLLSLPGKPCLTSTDIWLTRQLPAAGKLQSWVLAMNDWLGPIMVLRHDKPFLVNGRLKVIRADDKPGLLIFSQTDGKSTETFFFNNALQAVELPKVNTDKLILARGLNLDGPKPTLVGAGSFIEEN